MNRYHRTKESRILETVARPIKGRVFCLAISEEIAKHSRKAMGLTGVSIYKDNL